MERSDKKNYKMHKIQYVKKKYDPVKVGSIDGTDEFPHDKAIIRAINSTYKPNFKVKSRARTTIFIARLHPDTNEEDLKSKFSRYGKIRNCRLVRDIVTGVFKRYAFVEYKHTEDAEEAVRCMNKCFINGEQILVDFEFERKLEDWKPRRLGGGFGGRKESGQLRFGCIDRPFRTPILSPADCRKRSVVELSRKIKQNLT